MQEAGTPNQYQQLLNVSFGDEVGLFPTKIDDRRVILVKLQRSLHCFRLESPVDENGEWKALWSKENFFDGKVRDFRSSFFADETGWVLVRNQRGLQFYRMEGRDLALRHYGSDGRYRDMYGWNDRNTVFLMGPIYANVGKIGLLTRDKRGTVRFEQMMNEIVLKGGPQPLWPLQIHPNLPESWKQTSWLELANVDGGKQSAIVERSAGAIRVYKMNAKYQPQIVGRLESSRFAGEANDRALFGNVLGKSNYKDLLLLQSGGIRLYKLMDTRYSEVSLDEKLTTAALGWESKHRNTAILTDADGDGKDELWLSGSQGIVGFRASEDGFESIPYGPGLNDEVRFGRILAVLPGDNGPTFIAAGRRHMFSFALAPAKEIPTSANENPDHIEPAPVFTLNPHSGPSVEASLAEQLDTSLLVEPINPMNGNLQFAIPMVVVGKLFGLSTTKSIAYRETSNVSGSMGIGWSMQVDCVYVDRRNSIFTEDHRFYLIKDGSSSLLSARPSSSSTTDEEVATFSTGANNQTRITFDRALDQWVLEDERGERFTYGTYGPKKYVQMEPGSDDWPLRVDRRGTDQLLPSVWYLLRQSNQADQWMEYSYTRDSPSDNYRLDGITTSNEASLKMTYSRQLNSTLLTGFAVRTKTYTQSIALQYVVEEGKVRLGRISQFNKPLMEFSYHGPAGAMSEILYPNGLVAKFDYIPLEIGRNVLMNRFETHSHPKTAYGPSYLLVGEVTKHGQVRVRIRDALGSDTIPVQGADIPLLGKFPVTDYEMHPGETFFAVLLHHEASPSEVCLFQERADIWQTDPTYVKLPKGTQVRGGQDFLLAIQEHRVTVIERQNDQWKVLKPFENEKTSLMAFFSHGFLSYNDRQLMVFVRRGNQWSPAPLELPANLLESSSAVFDRFEHTPEMIDILQRDVRMDALAMFHNVIVFRSVYLDGSKLYTRLHLLHLNRRHEVSRRKVIDILVEDLDTYTFNPPEVDGNTFAFGYRLEDGKFRLKVVEHHGKILDNIDAIKRQVEQEIRDEPNAPEAEKQRHRKEWHEKLDGDLQEIYRNITSQIPFAIDPSKFRLIVNEAHVVTANHKVLFDGVDWSTERIPQEEITMDRISVNLGSSYRLVKTDRNATFDLIGPNQTAVFNTDTTNATELLIRYPAFMAVQSNASTAQLYSFQRHELITLPDGEVLDPNSNSQAIISSTSDGKNLLVRSMKAFGITWQNVVWSHELIDGRGRGRKLVNFYRFDPTTAKPYADRFLMRDVKITPASTKGPYGWFQVHYNYANHTQSTKAVYSSSGEFVKLMDPTPSDKDEEKPLDPDGVLMARDGRTIVADFRPFRLSEEKVSYHGFEPYEQRPRHWRWTGGIVRSEHGNRFLRLARSDSIKATMSPRIQFDTLVVSCWLRGPTRAEEAGRKLLVKYNGQTAHGSVGFTVDGWHYVEVTVNNTMRLDIALSPGTDATLDVDHLRVFPSELDLNVHIYDATLARERSTMHASGLMTHYLYDSLGRDLGRLGERGSVEEFNIVSRVHNTRIEIQPAEGELLKETEPNAYSGSFRYVPDTAVLRFRYGGDLPSGEVTVQLSTRLLTVKISGGEAFLQDLEHSVKVPPQGDVAIFSAGHRYSVWIDGQLVLENLSPGMELTRYDIRGRDVDVWDAVLLYDVNVKVVYLSDFGMPKQVLELKDPDTVALQEIVFDELNRPAIKTKWTQLSAPDSVDLFAYRRDFVENEKQLWQQDRMEGIVSLLNEDCEGLPYSRTVYANNPLEEKVIQSLPGKAFAANGPFARHFNGKRRMDFLENLFPPVDGFRYEDERLPDQSIYVTVYNGRRLKVAEYVRTHQGDHRLTTYEYDRNDRLVLQLPPVYHERANTFSRTSPFFGGPFSADETAMQRSWGTWFEYEQTSGLLSVKRTPDSGNTRYMYTPEGFLRFVTKPTSRQVMYFTYSSVGKLAQRGILELDASELASYLPNESRLPESSNFIVLEHGSNDVAPVHRHRVENILRVSNDHTLSDLLIFNHRGQLTTSAVYSNTNDALTIGYQYRKGHLHEVHYPITVRGKPFRVRYDYDHRGKLVGVSNAVTDERFLEIENNSLGLPERTVVQPGSSHAYQRTFQYNEPGFLTKIQDPYLTESIDYLGTGYGGRPVGDGTVQATRFNATWHGHSDARLLKLKPSHLGKGRRSRFCFDALTSAGYLDAQGRPVRSFYPTLAESLPIVCRVGVFGHQVAAALNGRGFPQVYGHRYDYGNHRQLVRGKYFQSADEERYVPLRSGSFAEISGISPEASEDIWARLKNAGFLHTDCTGLSEADCHGLPGKSLFHPVISGHANAASLSGLMARVIAKRTNLSKGAFEQLCAKWYRDEGPDVHSDACNSTWATLTDGAFVGDGSNVHRNAISPELRELLEKYTAFLPDIVGLLYHQFATALGHNSADVQSYGIDANGNHRHFYTGFRRYRVEYAEHTNKISAVYRTDFAGSASGLLEEERFAVDHNDDGSVTRALHKGIERIVYDPLFNRATDVTLTDGRRLKFDYNVRGHRLYKHVFDRAGKLARKKYYVRDVQGKPLIEYDAVYGGDGEPTITATVFLYAVDRLVGFVRNDQFYSVALDHEGSVRLVIRNGEIVAAYDYLPYGELLRSYGEDRDGQLDYRFTGKEWDAEMGLYDFHARLYDPELGRFYQMDPKEQYASPYLYAGNSPVSLIDPDGQFAFIIAVALAIGGAYIGASAANNSWNPAKWTLKKTLLGGLIGGVIGWFAPQAIIGSFNFLAVYVGTAAAIGVITATSVGFAYINIAAANGNWDPSKWNWSSPGTWNALFIGSLTGASVFNVAAGVANAFQAYQGLSRTAFVIVTTGTTGGFLLYNGSKANDGNLLFWEWDWSKPATVWGVIEGSFFGLSLSPAMHSTTLQVTERLKNLKEIGKAIKTNDFKVFGKLLKQEVEAWEKLVRDTLNSNPITDALKAGKGAGVTSGTILIDKIPKQGMDMFERVMAIKFIGSKFGNEKNRRSIEYDNATMSALSHFHPERVGLSLGKIGHDIDLPDAVLFAVSGSSRISSWLNDIISTVFVPSEEHQRTEGDGSGRTSIRPFVDRPKEPRKTFQVPNCFLIPQKEFPSRVVCYERYGISYVFPHQQTGMTAITEDRYSLCVPMEYEGYPSVVCQGAASSYVFTPHRTVNYLDHLNGTLTLLLVAPRVVKSVASFIGKLFNGTAGDRKPTQLISEHEQTELERQFRGLQRTVKEYRQLATSPADSGWLEHVFRDIEEDVEQFLSSREPSRELHQQLIDRMLALDEELTESKQMIIIRRTFDQMWTSENVQQPSTVGWDAFETGLSEAFSRPTSGVAVMGHLLDARI